MKDFYKNISIYGILPVLGKFLGFFLVPVYARIFSSEKFGEVELIISLISFLMYLVNLEFYTAIGRYFYDKPSDSDKKRLISTGFILTFFTSVIVLLIVTSSENLILKYYLNGNNLRYELRVGFVWLFISAFSTYLGVIPRYAKKPKLFVIVNSVSLLLRLVSTIFFVLVLKVGIVGVIYGHICGASLSLMLNWFISRQYVGFCFSKEDAKLILKFALPLVPGLVLVGFWQPLFRNMMSIYFSVAVVGLFSFASRITSITTMFNGALRNAWRPMLFENINDPTFISETKKTSGDISFLILSIGVLLTVFAKEFCLIIGTGEYVDAAFFIPFLVLSGYFNINVEMRGFGPYISKKTVITSFASIMAFLLAGLSFFLIKSKLGIIGIGLVVVIYDSIPYLIQYLYTRFYIKQSLIPVYEHYLVFLLFVSFVLLYFNMPIGLKLSYSFLSFIVIYFFNKKYYGLFMKNHYDK